MNIGILTCGGDCPGLNAAIRAVTRRSISAYGYNVLGIKNGWIGLAEGDVQPLTLESVSGILIKGGTILGTSRRNPLKHKEDLEEIKENIKKFDLQALIAIGGDEALSVAYHLSEIGYSVIGIPATIDNDIFGTDRTFGFDTAITIVTEAVDRLHTTAESHHRVMVVEVMGRNTGWIAATAGMAGGADLILIPEVPFSIKKVCDLIRARGERGKTFSIVVVAEGAKSVEQKEPVTTTDKLDEFGHVILGGIGDVLGHEIEANTDLETRVARLGHIQRGGTPTAYDRVLATRLGVEAADFVNQREFGCMVGLQGTQIVPVPLKDVSIGQKNVDKRLYEIAEVFFG